MSEQESDFPPWEDATEDLKSNIIEATPKQAEKIKSHRDIVRITPIEATSLEDGLEPEEESPKAPYVAMADESSSSNRGGLLYTVFLRRTPDANTNVDLIPNALAREDLSSWVDIDEQTISKTISATSGEISTIRRRPDFERVIRLEAATYETAILQQQEYLERSGYIILPNDPGTQGQCKATNSSLDLLFGTDIEAQMIVESLDGVKSVQPNLHNLNRRYVAGRYYIDPLDRENQEQCAETGASLAKLLGEHNCDPYNSVSDGKLSKWTADLSNEQHLLTDMAMENGDKPWFDDDDEGEDDEDMHSHGTCGAGKALGTRFGVSKKATLIVVRMHEVTSEEFQAALELILADLEDHPERQKNSVVTMSLTLGQDWEEDDNLPDFTELFQKLFAMDVPLVCISGNIEEGFEEPEVDEYPPLMEGPDLPLIVVGSVDSTGNRSEFSKGGPHVTLHAVGDPIECLPRDSKDPVERAGTSYGMPIDITKSFLQLTQASTAAPQVAGEIANLLSYVEQEEVKHLIEDEFCPEAGSSRGLRRQGSALSRTYNIDTPNKVTLSVSLDQGHSVTGCVKYLMMTMYNCYRVDNDPSDYKGGGQTIVGDATYEVYPGSLRSPSKYGKQAGCDSTYKFTFNEYWVWGHGWASSDHGEALKKEIKGCTLLPDTWKFTYDIGEYGLGKASGIGDFGCAGSGKWILDIAKNSAYLESRVLPRAFRFGLFIETQ
ncbi:unnamed protein product [Fusarium fujikuroi]|uniref:Peptidase S8/S53 domain-containing protein n=1 Tax=Fusarium fujikuroi TaxID=5127 RepID=A0A9Q9U8G3_FUSFU|nr:unnamed protein product [Fusarium fujikuroi]